MKIVGLQKISTIDYPGEICCVVKKDIFCFSARYFVPDCCLLKRSEIFCLYFYSMKNYGVSDTHNFSWISGHGRLI